LELDRIKNIINGSTKKDKYKIRDRFKHLFQLRIAIIWSVSDVDDVKMLVQWMQLVME
jgi:hypothetical protein